MRKRKTTEDFIQQAHSTHGDKYDYSKVEYVSAKTKVNIICNLHGEWSTTPDHHLRASGCPECGKETIRYKRKVRASNQRNWDFQQPEEYKLIPLTQGKFTKVDNEDFERLKDINWCFSKGYARNDTYGFMHRYIMNAPDHLEVDHVHHNTLDNRRSELRLTTKPQNLANSQSHSDSKSNYKGVTICKRDNIIYAKVNHDGKTYYLGAFKTEEEAGKAYDRKALELFGEFAYLNFPELKEQYLKEINR